MELLITLIGNAAVDPNFRERFLAKPDDTIEKYGFRLTKADHEMMMDVFGDLTDTQRKELDQVFSTLQDKLYARVNAKTKSMLEVMGRCTPPCHWSIYPPASLMTELKKVG